jgi:feruloyl esterase
MNHCNGGPGANAFGGGGQRSAGQPPIAADPKHDGKQEDERSVSDPV